VDVSNGKIYALSLTTGTVLFTDTIGSVPTHFNSVSAGYGQIFVTASRQVRAYEPPMIVVFHTTPTTFPGTSTPGSIASCGGTFTDGELATCPASFSATANLPSPSAGWKFANWVWGGGVTCTSSGNTATCTTALVGGSLTAVYAAQISFMTNPSDSSAAINWATCSGTGKGNGVSIYSDTYGPVPACYFPSGYTLASWNCSGDLTCSGSDDPTSVTFAGPGTITLNLKTGTLTNPIATSLTTQATPSTSSLGGSFTVSGKLTANGIGLGPEPIVLVFSWSANTVTVTTLSDGSYTYTTTAPFSVGQFNVNAFFLGDYTGNPQDLPSKATATITVT